MAGPGFDFNPGSLPSLPSGRAFNPGLSKLKGAGNALGSAPRFNAKIEFKGLAELGRDLDAISGANLEMLVKPVMKNVADNMRYDIERESPERTGELKNSFEVKMHSEGIGFDIISSTIYHGVVNWGWKARRIRPRRFSRRPVRKAFGASSKRRLEEVIARRIGRS